MSGVPREHPIVPYHSLENWFKIVPSGNCRLDFVMQILVNTNRFLDLKMSSSVPETSSREYSLVCANFKDGASFCYCAYVLCVSDVVWDIQVS